jgi:hypothetical protein
MRGKVRARALILAVNRRHARKEILVLLASTGIFVLPRRRAPVQFVLSGGLRHAFGVEKV